MIEYFIMNLIIVALVSVFLATGVFNTGPKDSEGNKKTEILVEQSSETKSTEEKVKAELQAQAQAQAQAEAKAAAEAKAKAAAEAKAKAAAEAKAKAAAEAQAQAEAKARAEAEAKAVAETQNESKEIDSSEDSGINYLRLVLYIFGSILLISIGAYLYFRKRDNLLSRSTTRTPDSSRRDFGREVVAEPQEQKPKEEELKSEPQEEQPTEDEKK